MCNVTDAGVDVTPKFVKKNSRFGKIYYIMWLEQYISDSFTPWSNLFCWKE